MLRLPTHLVLTLLLAAGCDSTKDAPSVDAPIARDSLVVDASSIDGTAGSLATVVDCAGLTPDATVIYYVGPTPRTQTITAGQVVKFHMLDVHTAWETNGLWSATGDAETCVRFDGPGVYNFYCYFHAEETGSITVE